MMQTFLFLALSGAAIAGILPGLPAKIILSAFVLLAALAQAVGAAPVGYEDQGGFRSITR